MSTEARVAIVMANDVITARQKGRELAERLGLSSTDVTLVATAITEIARNIVEHADKGELTMALVRDGGRDGIRVVARDSGPGIADIALAMRDGYATGDGLGLGLPGARRLMSEFELVSIVGEGTTVTMTKWRS